MQPGDGYAAAAGVEAVAVGSVTVFDAVASELEGLGDPRLAGSALAATALVLAGELDDPDNSATSKSMVARALNETMGRLRELAPPVGEVNPLGDIRARRDRRTADAKG